MQNKLFAEEIQLDRLSKLGDSLEKLKVINFEDFRPTLEKAFHKDRKSNAGRPAFDVVMMFKILVLQRFFNLSDDQTEFQIMDRISFQRFIGISLGDRVPDAKTIWLFRNTLTQHKTIDELFTQFNDKLAAKRLITHTGTIIDATFVDAPRQRNSREENKQIKSGEVPEEWIEQPHKLAQKDTNARWAKKNSETHYGYKNHAKVDSESKLVTNYAVTAASVSDGDKFSEFIDKDDKAVYGDCAYASKEIPEHVQNCVCERGYRNRPLTEEQKRNNREKSRIRCRIEHVFAFMTVSMHGLTLRSIGIKRANFNIGLTNLVYNFFRYEVLERRGLCRG